MEENSVSNMGVFKTRRQLVIELEIIPLFNCALSKEELEELSTGNFVKNSVLMTKWRPPHVPASDDWAVIIPQTYRQEIVRTAHETPLAVLWA